MLYIIHCFGSQAQFSWEGAAQHNRGQIPLRYSVADQVADLDTDLRVRVVCVSQAGRKLG